MHILTPHGPRPVQAMIFDMDGTMIDSRDLHLEAWLQLARRLDAPADGIEQTLIRTFGQTNARIIPQLTERAMSETEIESFSLEKEALFREVAKGRVQLIGGLRELLDRSAQAGVLLGIASSAPLANIEFMLEEFGLRKLFASISHSGRVRSGKPHPETMLVAARDLHVAPPRCIVFEDAAVGLEAARRGGMIPVAIETHPNEALAEWAEIVSRDFHAVLPLLWG